MGNISTAFVKQYQSNLEHLVQQKGSVLRGAVRIESLTGEEGYFEQLDATSARRKTTRHEDVTYTDSVYARRRVIAFPWYVSDLIDKEDKVRMLVDPTSPYAQSQAFALGRAIDDEILTAASGTAYTGAAGTTATVLPSTQQISGGGTGLTITKLRFAKKILDNNDVDPSEARYIAVSGTQLSDLLSTTEITSADYNTVKALVSGQVDTFLGFKFLLCNRLGYTAGTSTRAVIAWAKGGLLLATSADIMTRIDLLPTKHYCTQVYVSMQVGATRMQEKKVVEIACGE